MVRTADPRAPLIAPRRPRDGRSGRPIPDIVSEVTPSVGIEYLRRALRRQIDSEGLRPFSLRTGIPLGRIRSVAEGRTPRGTTLEMIASALGLEFYIGPARPEAAAQRELPAEIAEALALPRDASVADALGALDKKALAAKLREEFGRARELLERAAAEAAIPGPAPGASARPPGRSGGAVAVIPVAPDVRLAAGGGEAVFEESSDVSIAVAAGALASWARPARLTCVRAAGDSMEPTIRDGDLVAVDPGRTDPLDGHVFAVRTDAGLVVKRLRRLDGRWLLTSDNAAHAPRPVAEEDRILGQIAWFGPPGRRDG